MLQNSIKGIIWDMDGVISDTQKFHSAVESQILERFAILFSPQEITEKYSGVRTHEFMNALLSQQSLPYNIEEIMREKWERMQQLAAQSVDAIPGAITLIRRLFGTGKPMAVASASNASYVEQVLQTLNIRNYFQYVVSGDMVKKGKPDPESFLLAANRINIEAPQCLVIEDGTSGMEAARIAGMKCIGLVTDTSKNYPTSFLVTSLDQITDKYLSSLL